MESLATTIWPILLLFALQEELLCPQCRLQPPNRFCIQLAILKTPWVGTKFLSSLQLLFTEGFGKEQWDSYPVPDVIFNFLLFLNLFSLSTFLPCTSLYPFQKWRGLTSLALISVNFLAPGLLSSPPVVKSLTAWHLSLAKCSARSSSKDRGLVEQTGAAWQGREREYVQKDGEKAEGREKGGYHLMPLTVCYALTCALCKYYFVLVCLYGIRIADCTDHL